MSRLGGELMLLLGRAESCKAAEIGRNGWVVQEIGIGLQTGAFPIGFRAANARPTIWQM